MTQKAVVYYRTRSREPKASAIALEAQRENVRRYIEGESYLIIMEYTEDESVDGSLPAYMSAVRMAESLTREDGFCANLIIATDEPIGSGAAWRLPDTVNDSCVMILHHVLRGPLQPFPPAIELPRVAPDGVSLFVAHRASPTVAVYLCNPTQEVLRNVTITSTWLFTEDVFFTVSERPELRRLFKEVGLEQIAAGSCEVRTWDLVPACTCVLGGSAYTNFSDATPWYLIEHTDEHGRSASLYGYLLDLDPANPFHGCVPGTASTASTA